MALLPEYRRVVRRSRLITVGTALVVLVAAAVARAEPQAATLAIDCSALGDDERSLLEARARAELAYMSQGNGSAVIACLPSRATITWLPQGAPPREGSVALDPDRTIAVDSILDALHGLLVAAPELPTARLAPRPTPSVPGAVATGAPTAELPGIAVLVGGDTELWSGDVRAAVGVHAGVRLALPRGWSASLVVGPEWGVGSSNGVRAWLLQGVARIDHGIIGHLSLGIGVIGSLLWASGTGSLAPSEQEGTSGGGLLALAYDGSMGPVHLAVGPEFEALVRPIVIDVEGREVFRVPVFLAALSLDVRVP